MLLKSVNWLLVLPTQTGFFFYVVIAGKFDFICTIKKSALLHLFQELGAAGEIEWMCDRHLIVYISEFMQYVAQHESELYLLLPSLESLV